MRFSIPLLPLAVSIRLENLAKNPFRSSRLRFRLRTMLILVSIVALIMAGLAQPSHLGRDHPFFRRSEPRFQSL